MLKRIIITITSLALMALVLYPVFLAGDLSSYASKQDKLISSMEGAQFSRDYISYIQEGNIEAVRSYSDPRFVDARFDETIRAALSFLPKENYKSVKFIGHHTNNVNSVSLINITSEHEFLDRWVLSSIAMKKQAGQYKVLGFTLQPMKVSLAELNQFSFWGQSMKHYAVFTVAILILLFNVYVLALCIKTPIQKRKWLWIIFILIGFLPISFNWNSGEFGFLLTRFFQIPLVNFSQMLYQPFIVSMSLPLGAIVFLLRRRKWPSKPQAS